jgi:Domain of Unknown Function (DUF1080)
VRLTLIFCLIAITFAQQTPPPARGGRGTIPTPPNLQWVKLFNGTDLTGWDPVGKEKWIVENGVLHGYAVTNAYGYLQTAKDYKDFQLSLRFRCVGNGNSGVFFHTRFKPGTVDVSQGLQFEIDPTPNHHTGGVYGDDRQWIVWPSVENEYVLRQQDWNEYLLIVQGNHYVSRLNGVIMVDFTDPTPKSFDGTIALQLHAGGGGNMEFKDIYLHDMTVR